jgi:hypothetical protein
MHEPDERVDGLESVFADRDVPETMEDAVVARLREEGSLIGKPAAGARGARRGAWIPRAAAAAALFVVGWGAGARFAPASAVAPDPSHVLLLWEGPDFDPGTGSAAVAAEYGTWAGEAARSAEWLTGNELSPRRVYVPGGEAPVFSGDATLGGYFLVTVGSDEEAWALAGDHPHVRRGGWIEVAPIVSR